MKTYNHKNEELISEESLAILHKNAKNTRIEKYKIKQVKTNGKLFLIGTMIVICIATYILGTIVG